MRDKKNKLLRFLKAAYLKLFRINDSPQKIALGFGLGVFLGIVPGTGPLAALFCAVILRVNRASSLLGSIITNTWINFATFLLAIKIGSAIMGVDWNTVYHSRSSLKVIAPVLVIGYFVIAVCAAITAYLTVLLILKLVKNARPRADKT